MRTILIGAAAIAVSLAGLSAQEREYQPTCNHVSGHLHPEQRD